MSFTAAVKYVPQLDPTTFQVQDTSVYAAPDTKANISARSLTILQFDGTAFPGYPNPIAWPINGPDLLIFTGMTKDYALQIIMTLTPVTPNGGSVYVAETDVATERFLQVGLFNIQVARLNVLNPSTLFDKAYRTSSIDLLVEGVNAQTGILYSNFTGAQQALTRSQNIINNTPL